MSLFDELQRVAEAVFEPAIEIIGDVASGAGGVVPSVPGLPSEIDPSTLISGLIGGDGNGAVQVRRAAAGVVDMTGFGGGNGREATRTIVETMDLATGKIIRRKILPGSPHLMNKDIAAAKKVFRATAELHKRMPRRTIKESKSKQLTDAATNAAISAVTCPPKKDC